MGTKSEHLKQWAHNRAFVGSIDPQYPDWIVVGMFYTALHAVETLFQHDGNRAMVGHKWRNETLRTVSKYRDKIWSHYRPIYDASRTMRYDCEVKWISIDDVKTKLAPRLYGVEKAVFGLTGLAEMNVKPIW
jgi:hypothetical protein